MKKALVGFGLALVLVVGLMGFSQVGEGKKSLCTVELWPASWLSEKGIYIYKADSPVQKNDLVTGSGHRLHEQLHNELNKLYSEGWSIVSVYSTDGGIRVYSLER